MYFAQLKLNSTSREVHRDLGNAHGLHQRIMQAFPDEEREKARADWQVLFRQEPEGEVILVSSAIEGDWSRLPGSYLLGAKSKSVELDEESLAIGRILQFRLKANPSKRDNQSRKLIGLFHERDQLDWLERQGNNHGFMLQGVDVVPTPNVFGAKGKGSSPIRMTTVLFQGVLQVTDAERFLAAVRQGIGRGRSYGCGLLSVARVR
jgi:CRISPR system Cascade subunit CasE